MSGETELRQMINRAVLFANKCCEENRPINPMWYAVIDDGKHLIIPSPSNDKDCAVEVIKVIFENQHVVRYVFVDEAWYIEGKPSDFTEADRERIGREGLSKDPRRKEAVMFSAEDTERQLMARCDITRKDGKASLGPLIVNDYSRGTSEGRMVGLLRSTGTMQ